MTDPFQSRIIDEIKGLWNTIFEDRAYERRRLDQLEQRTVTLLAINFTWFLFALGALLWR